MGELQLRIDVRPEPMIVETVAIDIGQDRAVHFEPDAVGELHLRVQADRHAAPSLGLAQAEIVRRDRRYANQVRRDLAASKAIAVFIEIAVADIRSELSQRIGQEIVAGIGAAIAHAAVLHIRNRVRIVDEGGEILVVERAVDKVADAEIGFDEQAVVMIEAAERLAGVARHVVVAQP